MNAKYALVLILGLTGSFAQARDSYRGDERFKNRTLVCGSKTLKFSADAQNVQVGSKSSRVEWGNGGIDADINGVYLSMENGSWSFGDDDCTLR